MIELIHSKPCLVFGCGNPLFGDDGFGPEVIADLETNHSLPAHIACLDVGTSIRDFLFDILLAANKPQQMIIVDAVEAAGRKPGEVFEIDIDDMDPKKTHDYSLHQFPTTNMLKELQTATNMEVRLLVGQIETIPEEVAPGLSSAMEAAVPMASNRIVGMLKKEIA